MKFQATDGHLLDEFAKGNRNAIIAVCRESAHRLKACGCLTDEAVVDLLQQVLERIGEGQSPDQAFGWKQQRRGHMHQNNVLRDWDVRSTVLELMCEGKTRNQAISQVCSENNGDFLLGFKVIEKICSRLSIADQLQIPQDIFPLPEINGRFPWRRKSNLDLHRFSI